MGKSLKAFGWLGETFGPLVAFYAIEHLVSLRAAIVASIVIGLALVGRQLVRDRTISPFTAFVATSVVVFGVLDLRLQTPFFLKLEPALGNLATAAFFLGSVALGKPLIVELAEKQIGQEKIDRVRGYLTGVTVAWGVFFVIRAGIYVWMAYHLTLDQTLVVRATLGPASFFAMVGGEIAFRYLRFGKRAFARAA